MHWFRHISYNRKLVVVIMAISGLTLLLSGIAFVVSDTFLSRIYVGRDLAGLSQIVSESSAPALHARDADGARRILAALRARPYLAQACLYTDTRELFAEYLRDVDSPRCPQTVITSSGATAEGNLQIFRSVSESGAIAGFLVLNYRTSEAVAERRRLYVELAAAIVAVAALVALLLTIKLRLFLSRPLIELAEWTKTVSSTRDYGLRAVRRSEDEVGALVDSFNDMLAGIQQRDAELRAMHQELEERVVARTAELHQSERRFRQYVQEVREYAIFMLDPEGHVASWNEGAERIKGYREKEALGLHISRFYLEEDQKLGIPANALHVAAAQGRFEQEGWRIRKDGTRFWANAILTAIHDADGRLMGFSKITRDLTERKKAEEAMLAQSSDLARSNAELQRFAYVASHDLQEPLRMITTFMQLISERYKGKLDAEADEFIGYAVDGASRMKQLINDLLEYSRVSASREQPAETECEAVLQNVVKDLETLTSERGTLLTHDPLPAVMADRTQVEQLLQNLMTNAIKFSRPLEPRIHVSVTRRGTEWIFSVRDNGIGIRPEHQSRIFEMFKRLHDRTEYAGTGIGLAICKRIVEKHGGKIWVESAAGKGSTFFFTLPAVPPARKESHVDYPWLKTCG